MNVRRHNELRVLGFFLGEKTGRHRWFGDLCVLKRLVWLCLMMFCGVFFVDLLLKIGFGVSDFFLKLAKSAGIGVFSFES